MYDPTKPYKKQIFELIEKTWDNPYISVKKDVYSIIRKNFDLPEIDHSDGIGSKGVYHWERRTFRNAVLDTLAMNLNDLALMRAVPYKLQNHIIIPEDDKKAILEIVSSLSEICQERKIAITGGETSIHNNINGMDIGMTVSGVLPTEKPNQIVDGDVLIGFRSNGLHSNGFSKVREVFGNEYRKEFIEPTAIYIDTVLAIDKSFDIHGMMHMTGGSYTKLKDIISGVDLVINNQHKLKPQEIFTAMYKKGVSDEDMYKTFNCGVGFIISTVQADADAIIQKYPDTTDIIGRAKRGSRKVSVDSAFSNTKVVY